MEDALLAIAEALDKKTTWVDLVNTKYETHRLYISYCTRTGVLFVRRDLNTHETFAEVVCDSSQWELTKATLRAADIHREWRQYHEAQEESEPEEDDELPY